MFARQVLVPSPAERAQPYFQGVEEVGNLYDADAADIPRDLSDSEPHSTAGRSDTEGPVSGRSDTEGGYFGRTDMEGLYSGPSETEVSEPEEPEASTGIPRRRSRVRFTAPRQPTPGGGSDPEGGSGSPRRRKRVRFTLPRTGGDSRGGDPQVRKNIALALFNFLYTDWF